MSRTDIDAATLADYLRQMCGDGSVEWSYEPMQTSVLLDIADMLAESAKLRELVRDLYCLAYPSAVEWEVSDAAYDKYSPCKRCEELHGGKSPCASATKDMTEECCAPIQAVVVADRMRQLGIEVEQ